MNISKIVKCGLASMLLFSFSLLFSVQPVKGEEKITKDILLVETDDPTPEQAESEKCIISALSCAGYSLDLINESESSDYVDIYANVIFLPGTTADGVHKNNGRSIILGISAEETIWSLDAEAKEIYPRDDMVIVSLGGSKAATDKVQLNKYYVLKNATYKGGTISEVQGENSGVLVAGYGTTRVIQLEDYSSAFAQGILLNSIKGWMEINVDEKYTTGLNYMVLTDVSSNIENERLYEILKNAGESGGKYAAAIYPKKAADVSTDYLNELLYAKKNGATFILDLENWNVEEVSLKSIKSLVREYAEQEIYLKSALVSYKQLSNEESLAAIPSTLVFLDSSTIGEEVTPKELLKAMELAKKNGKIVVGTLPSFTSGEYHRTDLTGAMYISAEYTDDLLFGKISSARKSDLSFSNLSDNTAANLYRGKEEKTTEDISYVSVNARKPTPADKFDEFIDRQNKAVVIAVIAVVTLLLIGGYNRFRAKHPEWGL